MPSKREAALAALHKTVESAFELHVPEVRVVRNESLPQRLPRGGLVVLDDGETLVEAVVISPYAQHVEQVVECTLIAPAEDGSEALDEMLQRLHAALVADRTLGGAVDWVSMEAVETEPVDRDDSGPLRSARVTISLRFVTVGTPLE